MELDPTKDSPLDLERIRLRVIEEEPLDQRLARIPPVTSQENINQAFELNNLLNLCVRSGLFDWIDRIADSHTNAETRGWLFFQTICHICNQEDPLLERAIELSTRITDPTYLGSALGTIGERFFLLRDPQQALQWINRIDDPDLKSVVLKRCLNILYRNNQFHKVCCKIAAAIRDVRKKVPMGTSSIKEGLSDLEDKDMKRALTQYYHLNRDLF